MKDILIVLLVVALALLVVGAANSGQRVDLDYVFGTWHAVSLFSLIAIAVAVLVVVGLAAAAFEGIRAAGERRKLERELEHTYGRLREAEAQLAQAAGRPEAAPSPGEAGTDLSVTTLPAESATAPEQSREEGPAPAPDDRTVVLRTKAGGGDEEPGRDDADDGDGVGLQ